MKAYKQRVSDIVLSNKLERKGAVLIEGAKWCGKTTTARQQAESVLNLGDTTEYERSKDMMSINSRLLLDGKTPRLIDEWQTLPGLWDSIRSEVDNRGECGQFILTGSSLPPNISQMRHSGVGRISILKMRPMSLYESEEGNGSVSLAGIFDNPTIEPMHAEVTIDELAYQICRGGWPLATFQSGRASLSHARDYFDVVTEFDIQQIDGVKRRADRTKAIMRSYARNLGYQTPLSTIRADILQNECMSISDDTIADYVNAMSNMFVLEDMPSWNPNLRSKAAIRQTNCRYFVDPSIAAAAIGAGPGDLIKDLKTMGMFFENMAIRDLRVYAEAMEGNVLHFRDSNGLECDAVVHLRDGRYGLIEVKLGGENKIEEGAASLTKLHDTLDYSRMNKPSFMMVVVGAGQYAYKRKDGILVVPLACLKP